MKHIDEQRLETDLGYRVGYVGEFIGFGPKDIEAIHGSAPLLAPLVSSLVDAVYDKLFLYDATKRHFVPRQSGYEGATPENLDTLTMTHEMIKFRKQHLTRYLEALVTRPYDSKMLEYLNFARDRLPKGARQERHERGCSRGNEGDPPPPTRRRCGARAAIPAPVFTENVAFGCF